MKTPEEIKEGLYICYVQPGGTDLYDYKITLKAKQEENEDYMNLLGGYTADMLSDEEREKVSALVKEFEKSDEESD